MHALSGKTILIASGPTFAPIDAVRSITNHSSGRLGSEIGYQLHKAGADIIFLAGETSLTPKDLYADNTLEPMQLHHFKTVPELKNLLHSTLASKSIDVVIMAAAVLDYLPSEPVLNKQSSDQEEWVITLKRGGKLIEQIQHWNASTTIVGFKLESGIAEDALQEKVVDLMNRSGAKFVVGNLMEHIDAEKHYAHIYQRTKSNTDITVSKQLKSKREIAESLTQHLTEYFQALKETP
jgi:phosphopantothenoylcysteine synthetase/decarboxylase